MKHLLTIFISTLLLLLSCKDSSGPLSPGNGGSENITIGDVIDVFSQSVGTEGGTIKVNKPGDPLDGMEIIVQSNSFSTSKTFKISRAEIKGHKLGQYFNPITQMIKVAYEGGFSEKIIRLKIPIKLPQNHFAMGFFYDKSTGEVEGLPIENLNDSSITICTRHFTSNSAQRTEKVNKFGAVEIIGDIIISSINESVLNTTNIIESGFAPGKDDWEFVNWGSYIATAGHCAGQAITAIWYYIEKAKKGAGSLFGKYDKFTAANRPDSLWQDNPLGYRFASTIQQDMKFDSWVEEMDLQFTTPNLTFKAFALSMLETNQPQLVCIRKITPDTAGHAMIIYKIDYRNGILYVSDPNYPNNRASDGLGTYSERKIQFVNNKFNPYNSALNAGAPTSDFQQIGFFGKTAFINWEKINARWLEFEWKTIGQDRFPNYTLYIDNTSGNVLTDTLTYDKDTLKIVCKSTECAQWFLGTDHLQWIQLYNEQGNYLANIVPPGVLKIPLVPGINRVGVYTEGAYAQNKWGYIDFKWLTVNYTQATQPKLIITPNPLDGLKNKKYKFTAALQGATLPVKPKYVWSMDGSSPTKTVYGDNTLTYKYTSIGNKSINVSLSDSAAGAPFYYGSAQANIREAATNYEYLITSYLLYLRFTADMTFNPENAVSSELSISTDYYTYKQYDLVWDGNSFSINYTYSIPPTTPGGDSIFVNGNFNGTISSDGQTLLTFSAYEHREAAYGYLRNQTINLANVPMTSFNSGSCNAIHEGPQVANYITGITITGKANQSGQWVNYSLQSINYNSTYKPKLTVQFLR